MKVIPSNIAELLTPRAFAFWLASDSIIINEIVAYKFLRTLLLFPSFTCYDLFFWIN